MPGMSAGERLLRACHGLPAAELTYPFGPAPAVFKVGGKVFAIFSGPPGDVPPDQVTLKCDPEYATSLVRDHGRIGRGYHMNKRHWITVDLREDVGEGSRGDLSEQLLEDLVVDSYDLVVDSLPRRLRVAVDVARRDQGR
jgi:predicted DNA-binding protein (MmcQ/YjbR family)